MRQVGYLQEYERFADMKGTIYGNSLPRGHASEKKSLGTIAVEERTGELLVLG